jgi:hypothetical protein
MNEIIEVFALGIAIIFFGAVLGILLAFPIMWCWNYAVVAIWALPAITWGKAWCLMFLSGMLIKSTLASPKR